MIAKLIEEEIRIFLPYVKQKNILLSTVDDIDNYIVYLKGGGGVNLKFYRYYIVSYQKVRRKHINLFIT